MVEVNYLKIINTEDCCNGKWTKEEGGVKSIIDYVITRNDDGQWLNEMEIDEGNEITPYSFEKEENMEGRIVYPDHHMITCTVNWILHLKQHDTKRNSGIKPTQYKEFSKELKKQKVSEIIGEVNFVEKHTHWSEEVLRKDRSVWKVSRKLNKAKKHVTKELKNHLAKDKIEKLKIRKRLIIEVMEKAKRNKVRSEVAVKRVKKSAGVDSNTFWELK